MVLLDAHAAESRPALHEPEIDAPVAIDKHLALPFEEGDEWVSVPNWSRIPSTPYIPLRVWMISDELVGRLNDTPSYPTV